MKGKLATDKHGFVLCWKDKMPRKIRDLVTDLQNAGFVQIPGAGKGSHRKFVHSLYPGAVTLSGKDCSDAKHYQEKQVQRAIDEVDHEDD